MAATNKFWKITAEAKDVPAEIELTGEVCSERPVDWWTGEKLDGQFIAFDEFKEGLKLVKNAKNITIKLNSMGGDLFAGKAIYDELKALKAHKTVQIMGVAMSAASVIMLAGDKIVANTGDIIMIHEAHCSAWDYFDAEQAQRLVNSLNGCNKAMAELYAKKTGKGVQEILNAMHNETWFTAQQAKDYGLIDEVIENETQVTIAASADGKKLYSAGRVLNMEGGRVIPEAIKKLLPVHNEKQSPVAKADDINTSEKGAKEMETAVKIETVEALEKAYPDLVKAVRENASVEAKKSERKRIQEIEEVEASFILEKEKIFDAKFGEDVKDARDLAFMNAQAQAKIGAAELEKLKKDADNSNANKVTADGKDGMTDNKLNKEQLAAASVIAELDKEYC